MSMENLISVGSFVVLVVSEEVWNCYNDSFVIVFVNLNLNFCLVVIGLVVNYGLYCSLWCLFGIFIVSVLFCVLKFGWGDSFMCCFKFFVFVMGLESSLIFLGVFFFFFVLWLIFFVKVKVFFL